MSSADVGKALSRDTKAASASGDTKLPLLKRKKAKKKKSSAQLLVSSPLTRPAATPVPSLVATPPQIRASTKKKKHAIITLAKRAFEDSITPSEEAAAPKRPRAVVKAQNATTPTSFEDAVRFMQKHVKASDSSSESDTARKPRPTGPRTFPPHVHPAAGSDDDDTPHQSTKHNVKSTAIKQIKPVTPAATSQSNAGSLDRSKATPPSVHLAPAKAATCQPATIAARPQRVANTNSDELTPVNVVVKSKKKSKKASPTRTIAVASAIGEAKAPLKQEIHTTAAAPPKSTKHSPSDLSSDSDDDDGPRSVRTKSGKPVTPSTEQPATAPHPPSLGALDALLLTKTPLGSMEDSSDSDSRESPIRRKTFHQPQDSSDDDGDDRVDSHKMPTLPPRVLSKAKSAMSKNSKPAKDTKAAEAVRVIKGSSPQLNSPTTTSKPFNKPPKREPPPVHTNQTTVSRRENTSDSEQEFDLNVKSLPQGQASAKNSVGSTASKGNIADRAAQTAAAKSPSKATKTSTKIPKVKVTPAAEPPSKKRKVANGGAMLDDAVKVMQKLMHNASESPPTEVDPVAALSKAGRATFMNALIDSAAIDQWNLVEMGRLVRLFCHQWEYKRKKTARFLEQNCPEFVCAEFVEGLNIPLKVEQLVQLMRRGSATLAVLSAKLSACIESDLVRLADDAFLACIADVVDVDSMTQDEIADFVTPLIESANYMDDACKLLHRVCERWPVDTMQAFVQRVLLLNAVFDDLEGDPADISKYFPTCSFDLPNRMLRDLEDMDEHGNLKDFCAGEGDDDIEYEHRSSADELDALDDMIDKSPPTKRTTKMRPPSQTVEVATSDDDDSDENDTHVIDDDDDEDDEVEQWHQGPKSSAFRRKRSMFILDEASEEEDYESSDEGGDDDESVDEPGRRVERGTFDDDDASDVDTDNNRGDADDSEEETTNAVDDTEGDASDDEVQVRDPSDEDYSDQDDDMGDDDDSRASNEAAAESDQGDNDGGDAHDSDGVEDIDGDSDST